MPFSVDVTNPADNSLVSAFPSNERTHRTNFKSMWVVEHDEAEGRHKIPFGTIAQRGAIASPPDGMIFFITGANEFPTIDQRRSGAWQSFVSYGIGTTAQRDAQTGTPTGGIWFNTDTRAVDRYAGGWVPLLTFYGMGTAAERAALPGATITTGLLWFETDTNLLYRYAAGWVLFGAASGTQAARPAAAAANLGLLYGNTDDRVMQRSTGAAWVDLFPPLLLQKAESTFTGTSYGAAFAYARDTAGTSDLSVAVVTPARGTWMILVLANVVVAGPNNSKAILQCEIHEDAVFAGTRGGSGFPDVPTQNYAACALHVKTNPTAGVTYTFKVRAASQQNNSQSVAAGIYTALVKTA